MLKPDVARALEIHRRVVGKSLLKGKHGLHLLESAINAPFQICFSREVFRSPLEKSARILIGVIKNHPFVDGNKRTAFVLSKELLKEHGYTISGYTKEEMVSFLESIASSAEDFELLYEKTLSFYAKFLRRT